MRHMHHMPPSPPPARHHSSASPARSCALAAATNKAFRAQETWRMSGDSCLRYWRSHPVNHTSCINPCIHASTSTKLNKAICLRKSTASQLGVLARHLQSCNQLTFKSTLALLARLSICCSVYPATNAGSTLQHMLSLASSAKMALKVN